MNQIKQWTCLHPVLCKDKANQIHCAELAAQNANSSQSPALQSNFLSLFLITNSGLQIFIYIIWCFDTSYTLNKDCNLGKQAFSVTKSRMEITICSELSGSLHHDMYYTSTLKASFLDCLLLDVNIRMILWNLTHTQWTPFWPTNSTSSNCQLTPVTMALQKSTTWLNTLVNQH